MPAIRSALTLLAAALLAAAPGATAFPFWRRAVIAHDAVTGFAQTVPGDVEGAAMLKFKPWLNVRNGCVPFPAVDAQGNTGGGLATSGAPNGNCGRSLGQVYSRAAWHGGRFAIMYSWYMPKDSPSSGLGHRHDWECAVVWIDDPAAASPSVLAVSTSAHGDFDAHVGADAPLDGTRAKIDYFSIWPVNHQLGVTNTKGGEQPLVAWGSLTEAARGALTSTDFGSATVPFKESTFVGNLDKAAF